jgi:hypothetical protein
MTKYTVSQVVSGGNGISTVIFKSGHFVVFTDGQRRFYNKLGLGLCASPASRHYEACYDMLKAIPVSARA